MEVGLSVTRHDETYKDRRSRYIYISGEKAKASSLHKGEETAFRVVSTFFKSNNIKWFDMKEAFLKWCQLEEIFNPKEEAPALTLLLTRIILVKLLRVEQ
ncbi:hypothetical protein ACLOJK_011141 [Asimina triloba]